jgi:hypothetical protein
MHNNGIWVHSTIAIPQTIRDSREHHFGGFAPYKMVFFSSLEAGALPWGVRPPPQTGSFLHHAWKDAVWHYPSGYWWVCPWLGWWNRLEITHQTAYIKHRSAMLFFAIYLIHTHRSCKMLHHTTPENFPFNLFTQLLTWLIAPHSKSEKKRFW